MPEDLFDDYQEVCDIKYTTMSQEIRNFMLQYIKEHKKSEKNND